MRVVAAVAVAAVVCRAGPLDTHLTKETLAAFSAYEQKFHKQMDDESARPLQPWPGVLDGQAAIRAAAGNPIEISSGLVHDWTGQIFVPNAKAEAVIAVLRDFDHHASIYPDMVASKLIRTEGNISEGIWRIHKTQAMISMTADVYDEAEYRQIGTGKWVVIGHTPKINQIQDGKVLPDGEGYGFLWRMDSYWILEERNSGTLAELRTVSLSRAIPTGAGWVVKPFINSQPREAVGSTLARTRWAVTGRQSIASKR